MKKDRHALPDEITLRLRGVWIPQNKNHRVVRTRSNQVTLTGTPDGPEAIRTVYSLKLSRLNYWACCFGVN